MQGSFGLSGCLWDRNTIAMDGIDKRSHWTLLKCGERIVQSTKCVKQNGLIMSKRSFMGFQGYVVYNYVCVRTSQVTSCDGVTWLPENGLNSQDQAAILGRLTGSTRMRKCSWDAVVWQWAKTAIPFRYYVFCFFVWLDEKIEILYWYWITNVWNFSLLNNTVRMEQFPIA